MRTQRSVPQNQILVWVVNVEIRWTEAGISLQLSIPTSPIDPAVFRESYDLEASQTPYEQLNAPSEAGLGSGWFNVILSYVGISQVGTQGRNEYYAISSLNVGAALYPFPILLDVLIRLSNQIGDARTRCARIA